MRVTVTGVEALEALAGASHQATQERDAVEELRRALEAAAREEAPVGHGPTAGQLRDAITCTHDAGGLLLTAAVPYALFVVEGLDAAYMTWLLGKTVAFVGRDGTPVVRRVTRVGEWGGRSHWLRPAREPDDFFARALVHPLVENAVSALRMQGIPIGIVEYGAPR